MDLAADGGQIRAYFGMDGKRIGPCLDECADILLGIFDHQMSVKREPSDFPYRLHHRHTDRKIGHKMSVHHVEVDRVGPGCFNLAYLVAESSKVSREDRRRDFQAEAHTKEISRPMSGKQRREAGRILQAKN